MFVHSIDPSHIVFNVLLLLVFSPFLEKKFGPRAFILIYVVCAWIGYIFINQSYLINKEIVEKRIISTGINIKDIRLNNRHEVDQNYLDKLNEKQSIAVQEYNHITSKTNGASGALFGIVVIYILLNLKNFKKIFFIALGFYMLYLNLDSFLEPSALTNGSCYAHFGGMLGGFIVVLISLFFDLKKSNLR
jgi:membrane associated rhomboid family serine protease